MSLENFYVYQYITESGNPFYIGKGSKNRINDSHLPWLEIPAPEFRQIIKNNLTEKEAFDLELELIKKFGRKVDGGILDNKKLSRWVSQSGWKQSDEAKQKISNSNAGKVRTDQHKENYRKPKSVEHSEKIRQVVKNMWADPEYKTQRLALIKEKPFAHKGKPWSLARRDAHMKKQNNKGVA